MNTEAHSRIGRSVYFFSTKRPSVMIWKDRLTVAGVGRRKDCSTVPLLS